MKLLLSRRFASRPAASRLVSSTARWPAPPATATPPAARWATPPTGASSPWSSSCSVMLGAIGGFRLASRLARQASAARLRGTFARGRSPAQPDSLTPHDLRPFDRSARHRAQRLPARLRHRQHAGNAALVHAHALRRLGLVLRLHPLAVPARKSIPRRNYVGATSHLPTKLEGGVLVLEIVLLMAFAAPIWASRVDQFPTGPDVIHLRAVGQQFLWNFQYTGPDGKFGAPRHHSSSPRPIRSASTATTPMPPTISPPSERNASSGQPARASSTSCPRTSSTISASPTCASRRMPFPARSFRCGSCRSRPAPTRSSAPSSAATTIPP